MSPVLRDQPGDALARLLSSTLQGQGIPDGLAARASSAMVRAFAAERPGDLTAVEFGLVRRHMTLESLHDTISGLMAQLDHTLDGHRTAAPPPGGIFSPG